MQKIKVGKSSYALVDDSDYVELSQYKWHLCNGYASRVEPSYSLPRQKRIYMHQEIVEPMDGYITDHINGDRLDNTRSNLRRCTYQENNRNRKVAGVDYMKKARIFRARIQVDGKRIVLGCFKTKAIAAQAYKEACLKYFGDFSQFKRGV